MECPGRPRGVGSLIRSAQASFRLVAAMLPLSSADCLSLSSFPRPPRLPASRCLSPHGRPGSGWQRRSFVVDTCPPTKAQDMGAARIPVSRYVPGARGNCGLRALAKWAGAGRLVVARGSSAKKSTGSEMARPTRVKSSVAPDPAQPPSPLRPACCCNSANLRKQRRGGGGRGPPGLVR
jgi:hypothetical protein